MLSKIHRIDLLAGARKSLSLAPAGLKCGKSTEISVSGELPVLESLGKRAPQGAQGQHAALLRAESKWCTCHSDDCFLH